MSHPDISADRLAPLREIASDKHLTILLGAGASVPSGLPTWEELAIRLSVQSGLVDSVEAAKLLLGAPGQDLSFVMQAIQRKAGDAWLDMLIEALDSDTGPSELHLAAVAHYLHDSTRSTLATLNFDVLLELALWSELSESGESDPEVSIFEADLTEDHGVGVYHLHGHAFGGSVGDVVAGFDDYANLMTADEPWQKSFLEGALRRGSLLLVGTSYNDPDIRHWLHYALKKTAHRGKAIVVIVREGMKEIGGNGSISKRDFERISQALEAEWQSVGIRPIFMSDYADVASAIAELRKMSKPGYRTPQEVAASVWAAHSRNIAVLQTGYELRLARNAAGLRSALGGAPIHRPTLWLSDGRGFLVRWASRGSHYTEVADLKRIPTGHDSDWIAGEALSSTWFKTKAVQSEKKSRPSWKSVIAIPVQVQQINTAVITFGIDRTEEFVLGNKSWQAIAGSIGEEWGDALEKTLLEFDDPS